jgi:type IX secretion system PorP/SprF family membrane protein
MRVYLALIFVVIGASSLLAQDVHFSQYLNTPLVVNPALAGSEGDQRIFVNYRDQWRSVTAPYKTSLVSFETAILGSKTGANKLALGTYLYTDKAGDLELTNNLLSLSLSYRLSLSDKMFLSAGMQGGIGQRFVGATNQRWDNQFNGVNYDESISPSETIATSTQVMGDYSAGFLLTFAEGNSTLSSLNSKLLRVGVSTYHLNRPKLFNEKDYSRIVAHADGFFGVSNTKLAIHPAAWVTINKQSFELLVGSNFKYILQENSKYTNIVKGASLTLGLFYRYKDAVIPNFGIEFAKYAFSFSYDLNVSKLTSVSKSKGGFEVSIRFINPNPFRRSGSGGVKFL